MEMKSKITNLIQSFNSSYKERSALRHNFGTGIILLVLLLLCIPIISANAKPLSEQLDPTNILLEYNSPVSEDVNSLNAPMPADNSKKNIKEKSKLSDNSAVNFAAKINDNTSKKALNAVNTPNSEIEKKLWQTRISHIEDEKENKIKSELQRIIDEIETIEFQTPKETDKPVEEIKLPQKTVAKVTLPDTQFFEENIKTRPQYEIITDETLKIFEDLSQHPEQIENPFELAEVLFQSGHLKQAAKCYIQALEKEKTDKPDINEKIPWILLQIGNCSRKHDPQTAVKMYEQLITEYPNSMWVDVAKAQTQLIKWHTQAKPENLITENKF